MFLTRPPSDADIHRFLESQGAAGFTYPNPGSSRHSAPPGYQLNSAACELGRGAAAFERARQAVREWRMFDIGWTSVFWPEAPIAPGTIVAVLVRHFGFWSINAARIIYVIDETRKFGFAYGTLSDHAESGEERFLIEWRADDSVGYEILAFSRERHWLAKMAFPLTRSLQARFRKDSGAAMQRAVLSDT